MKKKIKDFVSTAKAAEILDISVPAVYSANKRGSLDFYEFEGGVNVVKLTDVLEYQKNRKVGRPAKNEKKK